MTLKERLDEKLRPLATLMWEELENIFLEHEPVQLEKGVTVSVFKNGTFSHISYKSSATEGKVGSPFSRNYSIDDLEKVIEIAKENGLEVTVLEKGSRYEFTYHPTWK